MLVAPPTPPRRSRAADAVRQRFRALEQQVRTTLCVSGVSRVVCVLLAGTIACGLVDWLLHLNDGGLRLLLGLSLAAGVGWTAWRWLWAPLAEQRSNSSLASLLEHRRPFIGNQLTSAAEFLEHKLDPRLGSPLLQQAVIDQAEHRLESLDLDTLVDRRDVRFWALAAAGGCIAAFLLFVCRPTESVTAITRLALPFADIPWPRRVQLELVEHDLSSWTAAAPHRVARGDSLELYARNLKGPLPDDVTLEFRVGDERALREPMRKTIIRDEQGRPVDVAGINLPVTRGPILIRVVGGDDDRMPFLPVDVVLPPEISDLKLRLQPPAYTGKPEETLPDGVGDIQGIAGTQVHLSAIVSQPLADAGLTFLGGGKIPLERSEDGLALTGTFSLDDPKVTGYRFELTTRDGFGSGDRATAYSIKLQPDQLPQVTLEEPAGDLTATADAVLPLKIAVKDDLGITSVRLTHAKYRSADPISRTLADYPHAPAEEKIAFDWPLAELSLAPGDRLQFQAEATDRYDLGAPHVGRSAARTVTIIGEEEKREELTNRLSELLADLSESVVLERRVAEQTGQMPSQLRAEEQIRRQDADLLRKLDLEQQRVLHQLLDPQASVRAEAQRLLEEFAANHLSNNETTQRLEKLAESLSELGKETLPDLQRDLTQAQKKAGDSTPAAKDELADDLERLAQRQSAALKELEKLEAGLEGWRDRRHVAQQLSGLIGAQQALNRNTRAAAEQQLTRDENSRPKDPQDLQKLAQRQRAEAEAIDQFRKQLEEMIESRADDAGMAEQLQKLADQLEESGVAGELRDAAALLTEGKPALASQQQEAALKKLEQLENVLEDRAADDQELLVKQMKGLEDQLEQLQKAEEQLAKDFDAANDLEGAEREEALEKLEKRQEELREDLAEIEEELERLELKGPQNALRRAGQQMEKAAGRNQSRGERQESLEEALDDVEQARRELAEERQRAEEELAFEQLLKLKDELQALAARQTAVRDEIVRLEELRIANGRLSRSQSRTLSQTAETERELAELLDGLAKRVQVVEVLTLTLKRLGGKMRHVAQHLEERQPDPSDAADEALLRDLETIQEQQQRLLAVLDASVNAGQPQPPNESTSPPGENQPSGPPGDVITLITQLELLKDLQAEYARRTIELEQHRAAGQALTPAETTEFASLAEDQSQLTDLARNLLSRLLEEQKPPQDNGQDAEKDE